MAASTVPRELGTEKLPSCVWSPLREGSADVRSKRRGFYAERLQLVTQTTQTDNLEKKTRLVPTNHMVYEERGECRICL